jgi:hypothetical protein
VDGVATELDGDGLAITEAAVEGNGAADHEVEAPPRVFHLVDSHRWPSNADQDLFVNAACERFLKGLDLGNMSAL